MEEEDSKGRMVVIRSGEGMRIIGRDSGVELDKEGEKEEKSLNEERKRGKVEKKKVIEVEMKKEEMDRRENGKELIRVKEIVRLIEEEGIKELMNIGNEGNEEEKKKLVNLERIEEGIIERRIERIESEMKEIIEKDLKIGERKIDRKMIRESMVRSDERKVDLGMMRGRKLDIGILGRLIEEMKGKIVVIKVDENLIIEIGKKILEKKNIEVLKEKESVEIGGIKLKKEVEDLKKRKVESKEEKVIERDGIELDIVEKIGKRRRGRIVDDEKKLKKGDIEGIIGGMKMGVVEVGRKSDEGMSKGLEKVGLRSLINIMKDNGGDMRRRIFIEVKIEKGIEIVEIEDIVRKKIIVIGENRIVIEKENKEIEGKKGELRVGEGMKIRRMKREELVKIGEGDDRRGGEWKLWILNEIRVI